MSKHVDKIYFFMKEEINLKDIILYHNNLLKFGGVDTFVYNFTKKLNKYYNIILLP